MKKIEMQQKNILLNLAQGRKLKRICNKLEWEDSVNSPSLNNTVTSAMFRADLITPEYLPNKMHIQENTTGYLVLSAKGKLYATDKYVNKRAYTSKPYFSHNNKPEYR